MRIPESGVGDCHIGALAELLSESRRTKLSEQIT
jgi:hypothetical protein